VLGQTVPTGCGGLAASSKLVNAVVVAAPETGVMIANPPSATAPMIRPTSLMRPFVMRLPPTTAA